MISTAMNKHARVAGLENIRVANEVATLAKNVEISTITA